MGDAPMTSTKYRKVQRFFWSSHWFRKFWKNSWSFMIIMFKSVNFFGMFGATVLRGKNTILRIFSEFLELIYSRKKWNWKKMFLKLESANKLQKFWKNSQKCIFLVKITMIFFRIVGVDVRLRKMFEIFDRVSLWRFDEFDNL